MGIIELHHIFLVASRTYMRILRSDDWILAETRFPKAKLDPHNLRLQRSWIIFKVKEMPPSGEAEAYIPAHETIERETIIQLNLESNELIPHSVLERFKTASRNGTIRPPDPAEQCALRFLEREIQQCLVRKPSCFSAGINRLHGFSARRYNGKPSHSMRIHAK